MCAYIIDQFIAFLVYRIAQRITMCVSVLTSAHNIMYVYNTLPDWMPIRHAKLSLYATFGMNSYIHYPRHMHGIPPDQTDRSMCAWELFVLARGKYEGEQKDIRWIWIRMDYGRRLSPNEWYIQVVSKFFKLTMNTYIFQQRITWPDATREHALTRPQLWMHTVSTRAYTI